MPTIKSTSSSSATFANRWNSPSYDTTTYDLAYDSYHLNSLPTSSTANMFHDASYYDIDEHHDDEKLDSSEKEFDEDSYIRRILENPIYANYSETEPIDDAATASDHGNMSSLNLTTASATSAIDVTLSEYEQNILNKYLREFNDSGESNTESDDHQPINLLNICGTIDIASGSGFNDEPLTMATMPLIPTIQTPMPSSSMQMTSRQMSVSSSSLSSFNHTNDGDDTSDTIPDIFNSSRPITTNTTISTLNTINQNHNNNNAIINDINNQNYINDNINNNNNIDNHDSGREMINKFSERNQNNSRRRTFCRNLSLWIGVISCVLGIVFVFSDMLLF